MQHVATARLSRQASAFLERVAEIHRTGASPVLSCDGGLRIPTSFLAAEQSAPEPSGWRLVGGDDRLALALTLLGLGERFGVSSPEAHRSFLADPPYRVRLSPEGGLVMQPVVGAAGNPRLEASIAHAWVAAVEPPAVTIELANISHLNSILIAWMLQVAQGVRPAPVCIAKASAGVSAQLRQLRLDHLMALI